LNASTRTRLLRAALTCGALGVLPHVADAQTSAVVPASPEQVIQEGLRRQEERSRDQQKTLEPRASELAPDAKRASKEFPKEERCFVVNELSLLGPDSARFAWLLDSATQYLHRCVGVQGLSFIASELDAKLVDKGLATTRVSLPPQSLEAGKLALQIEVGRVAAVRMPDEGWGTWRNAFPVSAGDVLDVRDIEQGVENMKRLPSQSVAVRLEPGEAPGSSVVYIERKPTEFKDRLRGGLTIDNSGGPVLGRAQLSGNVALDNPTGLNDVLSANVITNAERPSQSHRSQSLSVSYSVPWGYNLLTLNASDSRFAQYVQGTTTRFLSSGRSSIAQLKLQRTVWRSASTKVGVYADVSTRRAVSFLDDVEVIVQRRHTTNAEAGISYEQLFERSSLNFDLSTRRGVPWQGAQDDFDSAAQGGLTLRPKIWMVDGAWTSAFSLAARPVQFSTSVHGQFTKDTTLSIDQMSIGGRGTVRGFDGDVALLAENGVVVRNELATPLQLWGGVDSSAYVAADWGRVWGPSDVLLVGHQLAGVAVGLRGRWHSYVFDAAVARPISRPQGFASSNACLYVSLTRTF
jgi:hemolysin activation/secretion protein